MITAIVLTGLLILSLTMILLRSWQISQMDEMEMRERGDAPSWKDEIKNSEEL